MFRRKGSEREKKERVDPAKGSDRDSTSSAGSGGIMNSMKAVIKKDRAAEAPEPSANKAVKDGSAHPHAGSDARVSECSNTVARAAYERKCVKFHKMLNFIFTLIVTF